MVMRKSQAHRCQNPNCGAEIRVQKESTDGFSNPICCCGAEMVREYEPPAFRKTKASPQVIALLSQKRK